MATSFAETLVEADRLTDLVDPEATPYVSKYAARELLKTWKDRLPHDEEPFAAARLAFRLGRIALDVEEPHEAQIELDAAADIFVPGFEAKVQERIGTEETAESQGDVKAAPPVHLASALLEEVKSARKGDVAQEALEVLNLLGILWSGREQLARSLMYLLASQELYSILDPLIDQQQTEGDSPAAAAAATAEPPRDQGTSRVHGVFRRELDSIYTHTLFYLAQVYGLLEKPDLSASYCQQTLKRQLELDVTLDTLGWVSNCLSLVDYFTKLKRDRQSACHGLCACTTLLEQRTPEGADPDRVANLKGEIARRWAWIYMGVLEDASTAHMLRDEEEEEEEVQQDHAKGEKPQQEEEEAKSVAEAEEGQATNTETSSSSSSSSLPPPPPSTTEPPPGQAATVGTSAEGERFEALSFQEPVIPDADTITTFDRAREVFLKANKALDEAKQVFVFNGFVTDHVNLVRDVSRIYRYLSVFEEDEKRKQAMYQRRATALQSVLSEISPKAYEGLHKQLSFELGEVYMEMMDIKLSRIDAKLADDPNYRPKRAEAEKCNELNSQACGAFEHFVEMYQVDDEKHPGKKVWQFDKDDLRPILRASFHLGRLYGRAHPLCSPQEALEASKKSLTQFTWLKNFAEANIRKYFNNDDGSFFNAEINVCDEMIKMLPEKINQIHYRGKRFN